MLDLQTQSRIETIVEDLVEDGKMFTAYDVTKTVRSKLDKGEKVYHSDVRRHVNDTWFANGQMFDDNNYTRSNITIPGISAIAWVYHHSMTDPNTYDKDALPEKDDNVKQDGSDPFGISDAIDSGDLKTGVKGCGIKPDNDGILTPDARGRICVPKKALEAIGLKPGDIAYIVKGNIVVEIVSFYQKNGVQYIVDKSGNVRFQFDKTMIYTSYTDNIILC